MLVLFTAVERTPEEQRQRPRQPGQWREQQRERGAVFEAVGMLGRVLRVQILPREQVPRRAAENFEVAGWLPCFTQIIGLIAVQQPRHRVVERRCCRERLPRGIRRRSQKVDRKQNASQPRHRNGTKPHADSVGESRHGKLAGGRTGNTRGRSLERYTGNGLETPWFHPLHLLPRYDRSRVTRAYCRRPCG